MDAFYSFSCLSIEFVIYLYIYSFVIILSYWLWLLCMLYSIAPSTKQKKFCELILCRSSCPEVFCKKSVLRNFAKFIGKHLCQSLFFNKVAGFRAATLLKKSFWHRCVPVNFAKFLSVPFLQNTSEWLLLFMACHFTWLSEQQRLLTYLISELTPLLKNKCSLFGAL